MRELFVGLPYCSYFACLACQIRDSWLAIDKHVVSLTQDPRKIDLMLGDSEDANEALFYIQDIFSSGDDNVTRMLANALLHYAYMPILIRSLCSMKLKPLLSLNTCLYVLTQTFRIIKEPSILNVLFSALFSSTLSKRLVDQLEPKDESYYQAPSFYQQKYTHLNSDHPSLSLPQYLIEYYNLYNFEVFLHHSSTLLADYQSILSTLQPSNEALSPS